MLTVRTNADPMIQRILDVIGCAKRITTINVESGKKTIDLTAGAYWSEGNKRDYFLVQIPSCRVLHTPTAHPFFEAKVAEDVLMKEFPIPPDIVVVCSSIFRGKGPYVTFYTATPPLWIAPPVELTKDEILVLRAHRGLKSSYGNHKDLRKYELMRYIGADTVDTTREILKEKKLLDKRGAITVEGLNAIANEPSFF